MMKLINEAYSKIEHGPLRYRIEAIPLAKEKRQAGYARFDLRISWQER